MYKVASAGHQRVLSRGKLADWQHGTERSFTPEEELRDVRTQNGQLNVIFNMMDKSDPRYAQMKVKLDAGELGGGLLHRLGNRIKASRDRPTFPDAASVDPLDRQRSPARDDQTGTSGRGKTPCRLNGQGAIGPRLGRLEHSHRQGDVSGRAIPPHLGPSHGVEPLLENLSHGRVHAGDGPSRATCPSP